MGMPQRTRFTPQFSSNPSEFGLGDVDEDEEFFLSILECDDFWWDEEERHELF